MNQICKSAINFSFSVTCFFSILFLASLAFANNDPGIKILGPTSPPSVQGPTSTPPTVAQVNEIKRMAGHEEFIVEENGAGIGFFESIWNWMVSLWSL